MGVSRAERFLSNAIELVENFLEPNDITNLRTQLDETQRKKDGPWYRKKPSAQSRFELMEIRRRLEAHFQAYYGLLGPPFLSQFTWRPMRTGPEPMHYDKEKGLVITAFVNIGVSPRVWNVGPARKAPTGAKCELPDGGDHKTVEFPPLSMWVCRAETVAHQIVSGMGMVQYNWHCWE